MRIGKTGKRLGLTLALSSLPWLGVFAASQPEDIQQLLVQGHYWVGQGQPQLATRAWEKVLLTDPNNAEARAALEELKDFHPSLIDQTQLRLARELARQHKYAEALEKYRLAFSGGTPNSFYAAEYYETMSGTRGGWKQAASSLRELHRKYPSNPYYTLVLGRVLTYRQSTRHEGIGILEALANDKNQDPEIRKQAEVAWKNALLWLPGQPKDRPLYQAWLKLHPDDKDIQKRLADIGRVSASTNREQAWTKLDAGELDAAAKMFSRLLQQSPDDAELLAGLGVTRMRQQRFSAAADLLEKAVSIDPEGQRDRQPLLQEARYWHHFKLAEQLMKRRHYKAALKQLDTAESINPGRIETDLLRAAIETRRGNWQKASRLYDHILERQPDNAQARKGLLQVLIQSGQEDAARRLLAKHKLSEQAWQEARNLQQAEKLRRQARAENDPRIAIIDLRKALALRPDDPWLRLDLARLLASQGRQKEADALFANYINTFAGDDETRFAAAIYFNETGNPQKALGLMASIPAAQKSEVQLSFQKRLQARLKLAEARKAIAQGDYRSANLIAESLQLIISSDPMARLIYAELLARLGQTREALWQAERAWKKADGDTSMALQYATVLLLTHRYSKLDELLTDLEHRTSLAPTQRIAVEKLRLGLELELADNLRKSGDYRAAWEQLKPFLPEHASDNALRSLMASIYLDAGDYERALRLYQEEVAHNPKNSDAWAGAIGAAMTLKDWPLAQQLIKQGLKANPDDPPLLLQRARLNYLRGARETSRRDLEALMTQYRQSLAAKSQRNAVYPPPGREEDVTTTSPVEDLPAWVLDAQKLLTRIEAETATSLTLGTSIKKRDGTAGLDQLTTLSLPLQWETSLNADQRWGIRVAPILLDAGTPAPSTEPLLGSAATVPGSITSDDLKEDGTELSLFWQGREWDADIGLSAAGFLLPNIEGGLKWKQQDLDRQLIVGAERRVIEESLLSRAGLSDGLTGIEWGGVTRNSIGFDHYLRNTNDGRTTIHTEAHYALLRGKHVEDNSQLTLSGAIHWDLIQRDDFKTQFGLRLGYQHFDKNLSGFTLGQGGYFSPRHHLTLSVPINISRQNGPFEYGASASFGLQYFDEDDSLYYPLDNELQQQLAASGNETTHKGESRSSFTTQLRAGFEYSLDAKLGIGGLLYSNRDNNFSEAGLALYLRYYFDRPAPSSSVDRWQRDGESSGLW